MQNRSRTTRNPSHRSYQSNDPGVCRDRDTGPPEPFPRLIELELVPWPAWGSRAQAASPVLHWQRELLRMITALLVALLLASEIRQGNSEEPYPPLGREDRT